MADKPYDKGNPEKGWGQVFPLYFRPGITVENHAVNGRSTKSFIDEGKWNIVKDRIKPGDYVIIEFGHNDEKIEDPKRYAAPETGFKTNLMIFITETRNAGGIPVLATPVNRRKFDSTGHFLDTHGKYPDVVRQLAKELNVPLLDLHKKTEQLLKDCGAEISKKFFIHVTSSEYPNLPTGRQDDTHFSAYGAFKICDFAAEEIKNKIPELAKYLKD